MRFLSLFRHFWVRFQANLRHFSGLFAGISRPFISSATKKWRSGVLVLFALIFLRGRAANQVPTFQHSMAKLSFDVLCFFLCFYRSNDGNNGQAAATAWESLFLPLVSDFRPNSP